MTYDYVRLFQPPSVRFRPKADIKRLKTLVLTECPLTTQSGHRSSEDMSWEDPDRAMKQKHSREEYCQRLLTSLILAAPDPGRAIMNFRSTHPD